jgi:hypothetical protein
MGTKKFIKNQNFAERTSEIQQLCAGIDSSCMRSTRFLLKGEITATSIAIGALSAPLALFQSQSLVWECRCFLLE